MIGRLIQIGLCFVFVEKQLEMGQIELAFKYTKKRLLRIPCEFSL